MAPPTATAAPAATPTPSASPAATGSTPWRLAQSFVMDEGWAAVIGAAAGLAGAALGAIGGYFSGRAQARGTVEGVQLQLAGQRADALWQAEIDACALFMDVSNRASLKLEQLRTITRLEHEGEQQVLLRIYGLDSRDQLVGQLGVLQDECILRETALLLRVPSADADTVQGVGEALTLAIGSMLRWCAARINQADDEADQRRDAEAKLATYRQLLTQFRITTQRRFQRRA